MDGVWRRIEAWLQAHAVDMLGSLRVGATADEIARTEAVLRVTFPADVQASYRLHNGQQATVDEPLGLVLGLINGWELMSLERMCREWAIWEGLRTHGDFDGITSTPHGPIKPDWWNPAWIPVTDNGFGDHYCLDLDPAAGGTRGQIIALWHDEPLRSVVAPSFEAWLAGFVDDLDSGRYEYSPDAGGVMKKEDLDLDRGYGLL